MGIFTRQFLVAAAAVACLSGAAHAQVTVPVGGTTSVPTNGGMNLGCNGLIVQGTFNVGDGQASNTGYVNINPTGTLNGGSGTLTVNGNWTNTGSFNPNSGTVVFTDGCTSGALTFSGNTVFNNLSFVSSTGQNFVLPAGANITVSGTLTLQGTAGQPLQLSSSTGQPALITLTPSARLVRANASLNNVQLVGLPSIPTLSEYGLMLMALLMAGAAYWRQGRTRR